MRAIRRGVFETNSSSTHSITMCSKSDYDRWNKGETILHNDNFMTREQAIENLKNNKWFAKYHADFDFSDEEATNEILKENGYYTSSDYFDNEYLESFEDTYTTPNGEVIVAFGMYGMDN